MYHYWKHKEYQVADKMSAAGFNAKRVPLSRNVLAGTHEDVVIDDGKMLVDVKSTIGKKLITIKREDLEKIQESALKLGYLGIISFSFKNDKNHYVILSLNDFIALKKFAIKYLEV